MRKIFFVIKALDNVGGTERVTIVLANALVQKGYEVHIVSLEGNHHPFTPIHEKVHLHYLVPGKDRLYFPFKDYRRHKRLKALFSQELPDFIVLVDASRMMTKMPACKGFSTIGWEHFNSSKETGLIHQLQRRYLSKHADAIVTLTLSDKEFYQRKWQPNKVVCIPNPLTIQLLPILEDPSKTVLSVGRFSFEKGFDQLIQAWSEIKDKTGWKLKIVGEGNQKTKLIAQIAAFHLQDSVEILPFTSHITEYYQNSSIYALPSRTEGLPLVLIEAGSMGLPSVAFNCSLGLHDIVEEGKTGLVVPLGDIHAFAQALEELMHNSSRRKAMAQAAPQHINQVFSSKAIIQSWLDLFDAIQSQSE